MKRPTVEINRDGQKVIINAADFNAGMIKWVDPACGGARKSPPPVPVLKFSRKAKMKGVGNESQQDEQYRPDK